MEIRFSAPFVKRITNPDDPRYACALDAFTWSAIEQEMGYEPTSLRGSGERAIRFVLDGATTDEYDRVIRALLTLDPDATIRTARAVYEGLADFENQRGKA